MYKQAYHRPAAEIAPSERRSGGAGVSLTARPQVRQLGQISSPLNAGGAGVIQYMRGAGVPAGGQDDSDHEYDDEVFDVYDPADDVAPPPNPAGGAARPAAAQAPPALVHAAASLVRAPVATASGAAAKPAAAKPITSAAAKPVAAKPIASAAAKPVAGKPIASAAAKPVAPKPVASAVAKAPFTAAAGFAKPQKGSGPAAQQPAPKPSGVAPRLAGAASPVPKPKPAAGAGAGALVVKRAPGHAAASKDSKADAAAASAAKAVPPPQRAPESPAISAAAASPVAAAEQNAAAAGLARYAEANARGLQIEAEFGETYAATGLRMWKAKNSHDAQRMPASVEEWEEIRAEIESLRANPEAAFSGMFADLGFGKGQYKLLSHRIGAGNCHGYALEGNVDRWIDLTFAELATRGWVLQPKSWSPGKGVAIGLWGESKRIAHSARWRQGRFEMVYPEFPLFAAKLPLPANLGTFLGFAELDPGQAAAWAAKNQRGAAAASKPGAASAAKKADSTGSGSGAPKPGNPGGASGSAAAK